MPQLDDLALMETRRLKLLAFRRRVKEFMANLEGRGYETNKAGIGSNKQPSTGNNA